MGNVPEVEMSKYKKHNEMSAKAKVWNNGPLQSACELV